MKVLAFDLSLSSSGWAYGAINGNSVEILASGVIPTSAKNSTPRRLKTIQDALESLFKEYPADCILKEQSFSNINIRATQQIFRVVGVFDLTTHLCGQAEALDIAQATIKKQMTGNGRAKKEEVAEAVIKKTGIKTTTNDESDAIALLLTYHKLQQTEGGDQSCSKKESKKSKKSSTKRSPQSGDGVMKKDGKGTTKKPPVKVFDTTATK